MFDRFFYITLRFEYLPYIKKEENEGWKTSIPG